MVIIYYFTVTQKVSKIIETFIFSTKIENFFNICYYIYTFKLYRTIIMDKLTEQQERIIKELLHRSKSEEFTQFILKMIQEHNWSRGMLSNCVRHLTHEQKILYESLGGGFSSHEIHENRKISKINMLICQELIKQGVTHYLYENREYINDIREGRIICEGINVEEIKNMVMS